MKASAAAPGEVVQAMKLPEYAHQGIVTHHLEAAVRSIELAEASTRPGDRIGHAKRAEEHLLYARRAVAAMIPEWREYNKRADQLIKRLESEGL
jgi:hypothetical protein